MPNFSAEFELLRFKVRTNIDEDFALRYVLTQELRDLNADFLSSEFFKRAEKWSFDEEVHVNQKAKTSVAAAFYGEKLQGSDAIIKRTAQLKGVPPQDILDIASGSGFDTTYQISSGLSEQQYLFTEMLVAQELCRESLSGINAYSPDLLLVATSIPTLPYFEKHIAQAINIEKPKAVPAPYLRACDSSGAAFYDVLSGKYDDLLRELHPKLQDGEPAVITIFAFEDAFRLSDRGGDQYSAQVFSTAAAAWSFYYHPDRPEQSTFTNVVGQQAEVEEGAECLRYLDITKNWPEGSYDPSNKAPYMTEPDNGMAVQMDPRMTPLYFRDNALAIAASVWQEFKHYLEEIEGNSLAASEVSARIKRVVVHHPSKTIYNHVRESLVGSRRKEGLGFTDEQIQWVITEGNAPATTIPIAFGRQLHDLDHNDYVMFLSYGAGGGFTCQVVQVNELHIPHS